MGFFSRKKEAVAATRGDDVAFETLRRSPRNSRKPRVAVGSLGDDGDNGVPLDPAQATKTRARRRLIGAVALALAAIVFVPMLFDRTPVAPPDDIALQIPDKDSPFEGRRGLPDASKGPLKPTSELPTVMSGAPAPAEPPPVDAARPSGRVSGIDGPAALPSDPPSGPGAPPRSPSKQTDATSGKSADKSTEKPTVIGEKAGDRSAGKAADGSPRPAEKATDKAAERSTEKPSTDKPSTDRPSTDRPKPPTTAGSSDDPHALAALEGRAETSGAAAGAPADPSAARNYAVQIAAFSAPDKARGLRDQLTANGLKSYTESVSTTQGLRTRVRLGPFPSRDAADRARQKLRTMKLDGSVVPL